MQTKFLVRQSIHLQENIIFMLIIRTFFLQPTSYYSNFEMCRMTFLKQYRVLRFIKKNHTTSLFNLIFTLHEIEKQHEKISRNKPKVHEILQF